MPDAEKRRQRRAYRRGLLRAGAVAAALFAMAGAGLLWYLDACIWDRVTYFNNLAKRRGIPEGVGPLGPADVAAQAISLRFHRKGRFGPVVRMEAVDHRGELSSRHGVGTYLRPAAEDPAPLPRRECQWEFVYDNQGRVVHEKALDRWDRLVWAFVYSPTASGVPVRGHFVGPGGFPQNQRVHHGVRRDRVHTRGLRADPPLHRSPWRPAARARRRLRDSAGIRRPRPDCLPGVPGRRGMADDRRGRQRGAAAEIRRDGERDRGQGGFDTRGRPRLVNDGYATVTARYDAHGNRVEEAYFDEQGTPTKVAAGFVCAMTRNDLHGNAGRGHPPRRGRPAHAPRSRLRPASVPVRRPRQSR